MGSKIEIKGWKRDKINTKNIYLFFLTLFWGYI
jgi:hypothetical protein